MQSEAASRAFEIQAKACDSYGSPFYAALLRRALGDLARDAGLARVLMPWVQADLQTWIADAVLLRFLGALHHLVLTGRAPQLAAAFPPYAADGAQAWKAASQALANHGDEIVSFMQHEPQTNEVNRSACLLAAIQSLASRLDQPLRLFELGASAGLNSMWDRFHYHLGEQRWGDPLSPVRVVSAWRGVAPPLFRDVRVIEKRACDRRPVSIDNPTERARLLAYVWPDQTERLVRLRAALELAGRCGVRVEQADAARWVGDAVDLREGAVTILFHTIFWQYVPEPTQRKLLSQIDQIGDQATDSAPFVWLRMEPKAGDMSIIELRCRAWPLGDDRLLAHVHPHGTWIDWV